ncbi:MAG: NAD(P)-dependent oxidoreductase [Bacteroidota bacterium]
MKIFLTGGSGFVGQSLIPDLLKQGHEVFALARSETSQQKVQAKGAQAVSGDLLNIKAYQSAIKGMDAVVHVAAKLEMWGKYEDFYQANVVATLALAKLAEAAAVKRFVYISAAAVVADGQPLIDIDEAYQPVQLPVDHYSRTKALAEQELLNLPGQMQKIVLRPPMIWGPAMPMIESFRETIEKNGFPTIGAKDHSLATIHVQNLLEAIQKALESKQKQGIYFVTDGDKRPLRLFLKELAKGYGLDTGNRRIPRVLALTMARLLESVWGAFNLKGAPPITRSMVYLMGTEFSISDRKARQELGYRNRISVEEGLARL